MTYGEDKKFLENHSIEAIELKSEDGASRVLLVPSWQGRVVTSTTGGEAGESFGWINYRFIEAGEVSPFFNSFGGEERFWIGPEGGRNSFYFKKGAPQTYENWVVPKVIDTETYDIETKNAQKVVFTKHARMENASGNKFNIAIHRTISLHKVDEVEALLGVQIPGEVKTLAYTTSNTIQNEGQNPWTKETGLPSIWLLASLTPTPTTTVLIPYNKDHKGKIVNDEYFGKVPADRLIVDDGMIYFKIDGQYRAKIGLPKGSAKDICGSYDSEAKVLNIIKYSLPEGDHSYVNSQWGEQEDPYCGDVINSYNDGPTETGYIQGPFYEIETSSPGAALVPGETITHCQTTIHLKGEEKDLDAIAKKVFGIGLDDIVKRF